MAGQTVETESLLKPILSPEEVPGKMLCLIIIYVSSWRDRVNCFTSSTAKSFLPSRLCAVCVHGTYRKNLESILKHGLKRMQRLHVHFSCGLPTDGKVISGEIFDPVCVLCSIMYLLFKPIYFPHSLYGRLNVNAEQREQYNGS